jgi:hypothetical protein
MSNTEENTINISDMLLSMAECVIETPQNFTIPKIPDIKKPTSSFQPKKPPKEIFYSKNLLYLEENVLVCIYVNTYLYMCVYTYIYKCIHTYI